MRHLIIFGLILFISASLFAQEQKPESRFSHKGFKVSGGLGGFENDFDEFGGKLDSGGAGFLSLGWGMSNHFTLWLAGLGADHFSPTLNRNKGGFVAFEISGQYKFMTESNFQPYGKLGIGAYFIGQDGIIFSGGGVSLGLGADYFFSPHVGVGLEVQFKGQGYSRRSVKVDGKDIVTDVDPKLDGKSSGVFLTLTLQ